MYLFFKKSIFVAFPNSDMMYRCIRVAESKVVAAKDTTRTTISAVIIKFQESNSTLLVFINGTLILLIVWMIVEGIIYMKNKIT